MGRLPKKGVDYFPHDVMASTKPTLFTVQQAFGNDGYAFWYKLLEFLGTKEGLYADFSNKKDWQYFISLARVSSQKAEEIMSLLADIDAIDQKLWREKRICWSDNFRNRLASVYTKRILSGPERPLTEDTEAGEEKKTDCVDSEKPSKEDTKEEKYKKTKYAEFVSMTETEHSTLVEKIGEAATKQCIEVLDNYKGSSGKKYKSDYRAILCWVIDRVSKEHHELFKTSQDAQEAEGNPFDEYGE